MFVRRSLDPNFLSEKCTIPLPFVIVQYPLFVAKLSDLKPLLEKVVTNHSITSCSCYSPVHYFVVKDSINMKYV